MKTSIFLLSIIYSIFTFSSEGPESLRGSTDLAFKSLSEINTPLIVNCLNASPETSNPICSSITDNFCDKFWSENNLGNIKTFDGQIMAGDSPKSGIKLTVFSNDRALISALPKLPEDIQKHLGPALKKLEKILEKEDSSNKWKREYALAKKEIDNAIEDIAEERYDSLGLSKASDFKKWNTEENSAYWKIYRDTQDEITKAKYADSPNWKRVEKVYENARELLINSITKLQIPKEKKDEMVNRLLEVKLTLPVLNPYTAGADDECGNTQINAFYSPYTRHFTVCAGYFNAYQSESALLFVIAHELGHSVDSESQARDHWRKESTGFKKLAALNNKSTQTYNCSEWTKMNKELFILPNKFEIKTSPLDNLYQCLRGDHELDAIELSKIIDIAKYQIRQTTSKSAEFSAYSSLITKLDKESRDGKNEFYYDPRKRIERANGYKETNQHRDTHSTEIFMQNFYCALEENKLTKDSFEKASKETKAKIFEQSIEQSAKIQVASFVEYYQYCGKNCEALASNDLSFNISEKVADWMANGIMPDYLKTLSADKREEASALSTSLFCHKNEESNELTLAEKKFSLESHPDARHRRVSLYTPETAAIINCNIQKGEEGDAKCKP